MFLVGVGVAGSEGQPPLNPGECERSQAIAKAGLAHRVRSPFHKTESGPGKVLQRSRGTRRVTNQSLTPPVPDSVQNC
jgi:hypothetical protein